ncbi:MAG: hypothetical protein GF307_11345 [candidate division Zixibacteria bacterium]|nr:hypothetical protein [candidate division Zixibacteria bacterium]
MKFSRKISLLSIPLIIAAVTLILLSENYTSYRYGGHADLRERLVRKSIEDFEAKDSIFYSYLFTGLIDSAEIRRKALEKRDSTHPEIERMEMYLELYRTSLIAEHGSKSTVHGVYRKYLESGFSKDAANPIGFFLSRPYPVLRLTSNSFAERYPRFCNGNSSIVSIADVEAESYDDGLFLDERLFKQEIRIVVLRTNQSRILPIGKHNRIYTSLNTANGGNKIIFSYKSQNPDTLRSYGYGHERIGLYSLKNSRLEQIYGDSLYGHSPLMISDSILIYVRRNINILNIMNHDIRRSPGRDPEWYFLMDNIGYGGGMIVFRGLQNVSNWQICYTDTAFSELVRITGYYERANYPTISSDGGYIAYLKERGSGEDEIYLYSVSDSTQARISDTGGKKAYLSFSDDDSYLIFCQKPINKPDSYFDIYCMNLKQRTTVVELLAYLDSMKNNGYE